MNRHRGAGADPSQATSLTATLDRLREAHDLGEDRLPEDVLARLDAMLDRAGSRRALSADHTVVGVFGATGSGKSSLVNALSGTEAARVAVRRPTTSEPLALVWGVGGSGELLDWLQVTQRVELPDGAPLLPANGYLDRPVPGSPGRITDGTAPAGSSRNGTGSEPDGHAPGPRRSGEATADALRGRGLLRFLRGWRRDRATATSDPRSTVAVAAATRASGDVSDAVGHRPETSATSPSAGDGRPGLILLDLPDFDSTALAHRDIVERMAGQVDVLVWVVDPQKYADAALHHGFLRGLASHETVTLVALNQVDRLSPQDADMVMASLRSILAAEGLPGATVLAVSARTGAGLDALAGEIRDLAGTRAAATRRLAADASRAAVEVLPFAVEQPVEQPSQKAQEALAAQLGAAAGIPTVVDAVRASYRRDAHAVTGWPATRWLARLRSDPLRRLNLRRQDVLPEHRTSSLSLNLPAQGAKVDQALRVFADATAGDVVEPWRSSIRDAARSTAPKVTEALDTAVTGTDLETGRRAWWGFFGLLQWVAFAALVGGLVWLGVLAGLGFLQLPAIDVPRVEGFPVPTLLILGGVGAGILLAVVAALLARAGAARRAARVRRRLLASCGQVTSDVVLRPVHAELERCNAFRAAVRSALPRT